VSYWAVKFVVELVRFVVSQSWFSKYPKYWRLLLGLLKKVS